MVRYFGFLANRECGEKLPQGFFIALVGEHRLDPAGEGLFLGTGQGLEGAHPVLLLPAPEAQVAEYLPHPLAEAAHLNEAGPDGVPQAHRNEQEDQDVAGQVVVDVYNDGIERGF